MSLHALAFAYARMRVPCLPFGTQLHTPAYPLEEKKKHSKTNAEQSARIDRQIVAGLATECVRQRIASAPERACSNTHTGNKRSCARGPLASQRATGERSAAACERHAIERHSIRFHRKRGGHSLDRASSLKRAQYVCLIFVCAAGLLCCRSDGARIFT